MKKIAYCTLLLFFSLCASLQAQTYSIIPEPVSLQSTSGIFSLSSGTTLVASNNAEARKVATYFSDKIKPATGLNLKTAESASGSKITFLLNTKPDAAIKPDGYLLDVTPTEVTIKANQPAGLFYGVQTLLQLLPKEIESKTAVSGINWQIPGVSISDYPRFAWRGIMLDVSRHFFPKEYVKAYIDQLVRYKYNVFHWHLTDDNGWRIEIKSYPKLTEVGAWRVERTGYFGDRKAQQEGEKPTYGGFYTQEDIKEIVKYAQDRHVTIVPEVDVPGHSMAAIAAYPWLSCTKNANTKVNPGTKFSEWYGNGKFKMLEDNTLNPSDEKVYEFLDKVFGEIATLFPGTYIHMGGDECYHGFWEKDPGCQALMKKQGLKTLEELQSYFVKRVEKIIEKKGKKLIGWDEILEGGLAPNAAVMSWRSVQGGIQAAKLKHPVVMSPVQYAYLDYMQGDISTEIRIYSTLRLKTSYDWNPVPAGVDSTYILGGQGNLWTEQVPTSRHVEYMTYPRAWALSEVYWSPKNKKNWDGFTKRVENHFSRADLAEVKYATTIYDPIFKIQKNSAGKIVVDLSTELSGLDIYYTTDNTFPDKFSNKYSKPVELPDGTDIFRVITYRDGKPLGKQITIKAEDLEKRAKK
ncbi:family 20 glycosylhydrolase [Cytophagaceae bacterium DM2B3-1]|uniref:beta-N-acetylhexosaminidase n=1 Tax=Xanthocytophaga flava TaxID=3048013 RepID=A0ABT7CSA3_9BACT|nr:family 20 glycosylhydrolase [Xanthocytophaga flavus]MDJ1471548.1 family 20 glycosylhydrolase [Xanthocytophaga flavus]MDJ1496602.1 family 20 glycosylhydrolase [Xanthocytophaga flavus]